MSQYFDDPIIPEYSDPVVEDPSEVRARREVIRENILAQDRQKYEPERIGAGTRFLLGVGQGLHGSVEGLAGAVEAVTPGPIGRSAGAIAERAYRRSQQYAIDDSEEGFDRGDFAQALGAGTASLVPSLLGGLVSFPVAIAAGALQQGGSTYRAARERFLKQGDDERTASLKALPIGILSGSITGAITRGFGMTGAEAIRRGAAFGSISNVIRTILRDSGLEAAEESTDQLAQGILERFSYNPEKSVESIVADTLLAGAAGGIIGGGVGGVREVAGRVARALEPSPEEVPSPQRTVIPAMLRPQFADQPSTGLPAEISTPQPPGSPFAPQPAPAPELAPVSPPAKSGPKRRPPSRAPEKKQLGYTPPALPVQPVVEPAGPPEGAAPTTLTGQPGAAPAPEATKKGETDALPIRSSEEVSSRETPETRPQVVQEVRRPGEPAAPQAPQVAGEVAQPDTEQLVQRLKVVTQQFNNKKLRKRDRDALIPEAKALRQELARRGRTVSVEELAGQPASTPAAVKKEAQEHVAETAAVQGQRAAKEVKSELIQRLELALKDAPDASEFAEKSYTTVKGETVRTKAEPEKITIEIPGDGTFTIVRTKQALEQVLKRAKALETTAKPPSRGERVPLGPRVSGEFSKGGGFVNPSAEEAQRQLAGFEAQVKEKKWTDTQRVYMDSRYGNMRVARPEDIDAKTVAELRAWFQARARQAAQLEPEAATQLDQARPAPTIKLLDGVPEDLSRIDRARAAVVAQLGPSFGTEALRGVNPDLRHEGTAIQLGLGEDSRQAIMAAFGQRLVFFESVYPINGLILSDQPGVIFLNIRSRRPLSTVIFHELMEQLRLNMPEDYQRFAGVLLEEMQNIEEYARILSGITKQPSSGAELLKELASDFAAYESQNPYFWQRMADRLGSAWVRIGNTILRWLNGVIQKIRGFETSRFFKDVDRVRNELADVMAMFAVQSRSPQAPQEGSQAFFQLDDVFKSKESLEQFIAKPTISPEEAQSLKQQAGAQAALVPDAIADEIRALDDADAVEKRIAANLQFVLRLHDMAPALEIQRILASNISDDLKDAAISGVLRQIEHVRVKTTEMDDQLQIATKNLERVVKSLGKISQQQLIEARAKQVADNLIAGYRSYLTAQAASLPADQNIAAARQQLIRRMDAVLTGIQTNSPDATHRALEAIAARIDELPVAQGPQAVIEAIQSKGILRGVVGDSVIDLLTEEKPGGLPPLLLNPATNDLLRSLAELQKKAATYAKQIEVVEQAFRGKGKGEPTPVELRKWAETYRKFRNKQADALKAIAETEREFREADEDVQVYGRSHEILERLQQDPSFRRQFEAALAKPTGHIFDDIVEATGPTLEKVYTSPRKHRDAEGNVVQNKFKAHLAPNQQADDATLREMQELVMEIDEFLAGANGEPVDPVEAKTWKQRADYIRKHLLQPKFAREIPGWTFETADGVISLNPLHAVQLVAGGRARGPRTELEAMGIRAAREANTDFRVADQALVRFGLTRNNKDYGDEATTVAVLAAVKSHGWVKPTRTALGKVVMEADPTRIKHWNETVLNPIIASGQAPGQMRLQAGNYIPGTGIKVTPEDMAAARLEKRFSQGIVQTTQGTAKNVPSLLLENPILLEDKFAGRRTRRAALGTGPLTMARRFSNWGRIFIKAWTDAATPAARRMLLNGPYLNAALGYVTTTNPEFENDSPLKPVYERYAARALEQEDAQIQSFDQLVDRLAEIAVEQKLFQTPQEAVEQIDATLLSEIDQYVQAYQKQLAEEEIKGEMPQSLLAYKSSVNSFTRARKRMVAPDPFYDYTLTEASDRIAFVAGAYELFQAKQIESLERLQAALGQKLTQLEGEIQALDRPGKMTNRQARREVQKRSAARLDDERFTYSRLIQHKRTIDKIIKDLKELVIDVRDQNDSVVLLALARFSSTMSSSLLSSPMAIANNLFGGAIGASWVVQRNLGRAHTLFTPFTAAKNLASVATKQLLSLYPARTAIGAVARSNLPLVHDMARDLESWLNQFAQFYSEAREWGLRTPPDIKNRLRAAGALKSSAGQIEFDQVPIPALIANQAESLPGLRQFLIHLRDKSPRLVDQLVNLANSETHRADIFEPLKKQATQVFAAREKLGQSNDFTQAANLLTPSELGLPKASGNRDAERMRQLFEIVGNLDSFLLDYYNRWKAAPESEKAAVPLFTNPADEGAVLYDLSAHGNIPTPGFAPPSMQGVGQRGIIKRLVFMFQNYVLRLSAQMERLVAKDPRDPKGWREAYAMWSIFATLLMFIIAGMLARETGVPATRLLTGREASSVTLGNVLSDPDAGMLARYTGIALANNLPYYGKIISELLGNPGYGNWWDAANIIPIAGFVKDAGMAIKRTAETGDPIFPAIDFIGRWMPPASPALRLMPDVAGDIEARNAARALRVVGPSEGMELAGGGGTYAQTPASIETRRLLAAAYRGDAEGVRRAFEAAVRERAEMGSPDPERAVLQSIAARTPARQVFGRSITPAEEVRLIARMSEPQRRAYGAANDAFQLINQTIGSSYNLTSEPRETRTRRSRFAGGRRRRSLFGGSRLPSIRRARTRRSPFSRSRIRTTGRRKRRSPARLSFSA